MIIILKEIIKTTDELGIKYLTVFAFSTENWYRPKEEVSYYGNLHIRNLHIQMRYGLIEEGRLQHFAGMKYYFSMKGKVYDRYEQEAPKCIMYY